MAVIAVVKFINSTKLQTRAGLNAILKYCSKDEKTINNGVKLVSGLNCLPQSVYNEFVNTKLQYDKDSGRMFYHLFQSFSQEEDITPKTAHEIALKLAEHFKNYEILVSTHLDRDHIHSHFIINSVSFENGKKLHLDNDEILKIRQKSDDLCREYGLSICEPKEKIDKVSGLSQREYRSAAKGESWKFSLMNTIDSAMKVAGNKQDFIEIMKLDGYEVKWTNERANITYTTPNGMKCRDNKLHEEKYLKGNMENEFGIREQIIRRATENAQSKRHQDSNADRKNSNRFGEKLDGITSTEQPAVRYDDRNFEPTIEINDRWGYEGAYEKDAVAVGENTGGYLEESKRYAESYRGEDEGILQTGWENERQLFRNVGNGTGENEFVYEKDDFVYDSSNDCISGIISLGHHLSKIIDNTPSKQKRNGKEKMSTSEREKRKALGQRDYDGPKMSM